MKRLLLAILIAATLTPALCGAQGMRADAAREAAFLYEVKIIDEFIERFNDEPTSFLRKEYLRLGKPITFNRRQLVAFLFERPEASDQLALAFINQVTDSATPQKLSFSDSNWYAEVMCAFTMNGKRVEIPLVLEIASDTDKSTRWMITGIGNAPIFQDAGNGTATTSVKDQKKYISPSDYATNFLQFHHILKPGFEAINYLSSKLLASERGQKFSQLVQSGKLKFEGAGQMRFYFFQIPNYTFVVERFVRQTMHSGWLISNLIATSDEEKRTRLEKLLQRTL